MSITAAANTLVLSASITASLDSISHIALLNSGGEYARKAFVSVDKITTTKYQFLFYFSEAEGNDTIVGVELEGNGASLTLDTGTAFANQALALVKTATQSLSIVWTVELV